MNANNGRTVATKSAELDSLCRTVKALNRNGILCDSYEEQDIKYIIVPNSGSVADCTTIGTQTDISVTKGLQLITVPNNCTQNMSENSIENNSVNYCSTVVMTERDLQIYNTNSMNDMMDSVEAREASLELNREIRFWRAAPSDEDREERERRKRRNTEQTRLRRQQMSEEERNRSRERDAQYKRDRYAKMSAEEKESRRRQLDTERTRLKRQLMSEEERDQFRERQALYKRNRYSNLSEEEREKLRQKWAQTARLKRQRMNEEERRKWRQRQAEYKRMRYKNMSEEQMQTIKDNKNGSNRRKSRPKCETHINRSQESSNQSSNGYSSTGRTDTSVETTVQSLPNDWRYKFEQMIKQYIDPNTEALNYNSFN